MSLRNPLSSRGVARASWSASRAPLFALLFIAAVGMGIGPIQCTPVDAPRFATGKPLFTSPQTNPVALSNDGQTLYVANTTAGSVSVVDVSNPASPVQIKEIVVGIDPVGIAVRPPVPGNPLTDPVPPPQDELVFVTNHISDSVSVISRNQLGVVQTIQQLEHADGGTTPDDLVTTTDEPVGVAFASPCLAFVTLDQPNQVIALELPDANGNQTCDELGGEWRIAPARIPITAQAPRALAVGDGKLFVAAFESGNQTEFPTCAPGDARTLTPGAADEGCEFQLRLIDSFSIDSFSPFRFGSIDLGTVFDFAARDPNIGGRVIRDSDVPDRDLFIYDLSAPGFDSDPSKPGVQPLQVIQHLGTLLYGVTTDGAGRVFVTNTDARNQLNGLDQLGNRMFDDRLSVLDCRGGPCAAPVAVDLDASAASLATTVPTPYGVAISGDGSTLVVTAAGSDGSAGFPGVYTVDAAGNVIAGVETGAIPQGVALRSGAGGAPDRAFVLNTVDSTLSVVDVRNPAAPTVEATIVVGSDPTSPVVRQGRIAFSSARGSTSGTFSCESCHPNGNIDQLLWTINAFEGPDDVPGIDPPEPRTTQPIRGLRDTLPLHWEGRLADPFPGKVTDPARPNLIPGDTAPDCDLATDGEVKCIRHLVNASLSGVMCAQPNCAVGPSGLPGAFSNQERNELATFLQAVSYPPSPRRRPSDKLSDAANLGVQDFFTDEDGLGVGRGQVGGAVGFGVTTCADNAIGCHSLPLTVGTNSKIVGGFDVPSARGMWDRFTLFSNGIMSSEETMRMAQDCANGIEPPPLPGLLGQLIVGDPCNLHSPVLPFTLNPLPFPTGEHIYDANEGYTERGAFLATFEGIFALAYGVRGDRIWEYQIELGVGFPGLAGRQVSVSPVNAHDATTLAAMDQLEAAAADGKIVAIARTPTLQDLRYDPPTDSWANAFALQGNASRQLRLSGAQLRDLAVSESATWTLTAELPEKITAGGADRQPLLNIDPDELAAETLDADGDGIPDPGGKAPAIPKPTPGLPASFQIGVQYLEPAAKLLVDGSVCHACTIALTSASNGQAAADVTIPQGLAAGTHVIQAQNPDGWVSNEMPVLAK